MTVAETVDLSELKIERKPHHPVSVKFRNPQGRWEVLFTCNTIAEAVAIIEPDGKLTFRPAALKQALGV